MADEKDNESMAGYDISAALSGSSASVSPQNQWAGTVIAFSSPGVSGGTYYTPQTFTTKPQAEATSAQGGAQASGYLTGDTVPQISQPQNVQLLLYAAIGIAAISLFIALRH